MNLNTVVTGKGPWTISYTINGVPQSPLVFGSLISPSPSTFTQTLPITTTQLFQLSSVTDGNGCSNTASDDFNIQVNTTPTISQQSSNQTICAGQTANFSVQLTGTGPWTVGYTANGFPQAIILGSAGSPNPAFFTFPVNPTVSTTYTLTNVQSANSCINTGTGSFSVTVNAAPTAQVASANAVICSGQSTPLALQLTGKGPWTLNYTINVIA